MSDACGECIPEQPNLVEGSSASMGSMRSSTNQHDKEEEVVRISHHTAAMYKCITCTH